MHIQEFPCLSVYKLYFRVIIIFFFLLSGLMLFPGKNATIADTNQLSYSCTVAFSFIYIYIYVYMFHFFNLLFSLFQVNKASIVKSKSNFSIHISKCFVTVPNAPITTGITSIFLILQILQVHASAHYNLYIWACGIYQYAFLTFISGRLCSRVLSVCIGKSHKILQFSDSKTFSRLCIYHFSALLKPHFSHSFQ